jgi:flavin reductase (DIM6/NTAB) family NADH-FMN oxidoreductase RutF
MQLAEHFGPPTDEAKIGGRRFVGPPRVHRKLEDVAYVRASRGCPVLNDAIAWLECVTEQFVPTGDHTLVVGRVADGRMVQAEKPLTSEYTGWPYAG